jgi:hypothetical protein
VAIGEPQPPPRPSATSADSATALRLIMLSVSESVAPLREWVRGEIAYYEGQGFTPREARAMTAATFMVVFGTPLRESDDKPPRTEE